ncbi:MAG: hypothetical protein E6I38_10740 [Chloroflexi bacterium]|nr:MAG: hypothetical protein E6I38_10740 [Chloroflexota bacterium]
MGIMPFHLEKGVMGLRFDYLTRSPEARQYLATQLGGGHPVDPFVVAANISIQGLQINVLNDDMTTFMNALDGLCALNNYRFDAHERRTGQEYQEDNNALEPRNQDTPGNRAAFVGYWTWAFAPGRSPALKDDMRRAMQKALNSSTPGPPRPRIDHWWDCTLPDGSAPQVICSLDVPSIARVLFCTPHLDQAAALGPVESIRRRDPNYPPR